MNKLLIQKGLKIIDLTETTKILPLTSEGYPCQKTISQGIKKQPALWFDKGTGAN